MLERQIKETNRLACILITLLIGVIGATGVVELLTDPFNIWSLMKVIVMAGTLPLNIFYSRKLPIEKSKYIYAIESTVFNIVVLLAATEVSAVVYIFPIIAVLLLMGDTRLMIICVGIAVVSEVVFGIKVTSFGDTVEGGKLTVGGTALLLSGMIYAFTSFWFYFKLSTKHSAEQLSVAEEGQKKAAEESEKNRNIVENVRKTLSEVAEGFNEVLENIRSVNRSMEEVAEGVEQVAMTTERQQNNTMTVSTKTDEVGQHSTQAMETGNRQAETIRVQSDITDKVAGAAAKIDEQMKLAVESTVILEENTNDIVKMADLVNDIASRTNLLSLNASIEAARAGDAGRGFAVVAEEIRSLADNTKETVKKMNDSVERILTSVRDVTEYTKTSGVSAAEQLELSGKLMEANESMENMTKDVLENVRNVQAAAQASVSGVRGLSDEITTLTALTEEETASSEQVVKMAHDSERKLAELVESVTKLDRELSAN
jgi:methyl-accepting chemotaxis protein